MIRDFIKGYIQLEMPDGRSVRFDLEGIDVEIEADYEWLEFYGRPLEHVKSGPDRVTLTGYVVEHLNNQSGFQNLNQNQKKVSWKP